MATPTAVYYTGNGAQTDYTFPFDYLDEDFVKVTLDGVASSAWSFHAANTIRFNVAPGNGAKIVIYRETPSDPLVDFDPAVTILGKDLNKATEQALDVAEEANFTSTFERLPIDATRTHWDAGGKRIINAGAPSAGSDLATKTYVDGATASVGDAYAAKTAAEAAKVAAETAEANAETAEANAEAAQTAAELARNLALTHKNDAATSASAAASSATAAASSATAAASSAAAADASAQSAAASVVAAASSFDQFDDRYLGQKTSDPALDNDGNALVAGALYFNTTINKMKVYTGASWQLAYNDTVAASAIPNDSAVTGANVANALDTLNTGKQEALGYTPVNKAGDTVTGNVTIQKTFPQLTLDETSTNTGIIALQVNGVKRWDVRGNGDSFIIYRLNSGGAVVDASLTIGASDGIPTFAITPRVGGNTVYHAGNVGTNGATLIGYTPANKAGDTVNSWVVNRTNGAFEALEVRTNQAGAWTLFKGTGAQYTCGTLNDNFEIRRTSNSGVFTWDGTNATIGGNTVYHAGNLPTVVSDVRLGASANGSTVNDQTTSAGSGCCITGLTRGSSDIITGFVYRPIQKYVSGSWVTVSQT